jgi:hypothetical protein
MNLRSPFRKSEKEVMLDPAFALVENRPEWRQFWKKELGGASEFFLDLRGMDNEIAHRARITSGQDHRNLNDLIHLYHSLSPMKDSPHRKANKKILQYTFKNPYIVNKTYLKMEREGLLGNKERPASKATSFFFQRTHL